MKALAAIAAISLTLFLVAARWPVAEPEPGQRPDKLLLTNLSVVDVKTGDIQQRQSILIVGGEIAEMGSAISADGVQVVDGRGRYAIPGLFDMHAHSIKMSPSLMHPLFIAAGVTALRDMGGCLGVPDAWVACADDKRRWDAEVREGTRVGPRYDQITSLAINGGSEVPDGIDPELGGASAEGARRRVAFDKARGIDFLKTYSRLPREGYFALADAARREGLYLAGHLPWSVSAFEAVAAGQRSIEHAFLFIWDCYPGLEGLRGTADPVALFTNQMRSKMIAGHDTAQCARLHDAMARAGVAFVPTHTTRKLDAFAHDEHFKNDVRLKYIPGPLRMMWREDAANMVARAGEGGTESYRAFFDFGIQQTGIAHRAGVTVLAGTDAPDSFAFPGSGLHDEMDHLRLAGLSPLEVLRSATLAPAKFLGLEGKAGVLKPGARADVVLLRVNPLEDIRAVREVDSVVVAGALYERAALDRMQAGVERAAGSWIMWPKFAWQILASPIMRKQFAD